MEREVKAADNDIVVIEALALFNPKPQWALDSYNTIRHDFTFPVTWSPKFAKSQFIKQFMKLYGIEVKEG
jgi:hypothetical protein